MHNQVGGVTALHPEDTPSFTLVYPSILPLDTEDGEDLAICGQLYALVGWQGLVVGDPVDGDVDVRGVTVEGHIFPVLYDCALAY